MKLELLSRRRTAICYFAITPYLQVKWGRKYAYEAHHGGENPWSEPVAAVCLAWLFWSIRLTILPKTPKPPAPLGKEQTGLAFLFSNDN